MKIIDIFLKIAGKNDFSVDDRVEWTYIMRLCWKYGMMMIRGWIVSLSHPKISRNVFIGKHVKLYMKQHISIGEKTKLHDNVVIDALSKEGVVLGHHVVLGRGTTIECTGSLAAIGKGVRIGDRTTFGGECFFGAAGGIEIGDDVVAGQFIRFHSENHNYENMEVLIKDQGVTHKGIKIGNNCWIGSGVVFLDGARLEDGCVVAANAVVTKHFPANSVIGGVPAKIIKQRGNE